MHLHNTHNCITTSKFVSYTQKRPKELGTIYVLLPSVNVPCLRLALASMMYIKYRTHSSTKRARLLLAALVYELRVLLHKIHLLTALKTLDMRYKLRLGDEPIRYIVQQYKSFCQRRNHLNSFEAWWIDRFSVYRSSERYTTAGDLLSVWGKIY